MSLLPARRSAVLQRWFQLIAESYPSGVARFLTSEPDPFQNPVGQTIRRQSERIVDGLMAGGAVDELLPALDDIVRIRAVQDFAPSQAVGFVFLLKRALREQAGESASPELGELEDRIDTLACMAFDVYMSCREKIYQIKASELQNRTYKLLERLQDGDQDGKGE